MKNLFTEKQSLLLIMRMNTEIDRTRIRFTSLPIFVKKEILWSDVKSAAVINYGFVGGWGIRIGTKFGTVYNIRGKMGLALELHNGKKLVIGTQKETELKEFLQTLDKE